MSKSKPGRIDFMNLTGASVGNASGEAKNAAYKAIRPSNAVSSSTFETDMAATAKKPLLSLEDRRL